MTRGVCLHKKILLGTSTQMQILATLTVNEEHSLSRLVSSAEEFKRQLFPSLIVFPFMSLSLLFVLFILFFAKCDYSCIKRVRVLECHRDYV